MAQTPVRVYADTSVLGGASDPGFEEPTRRFLQQVREGQLRLVLSVTVREELEGAPTEVRELFEEMLGFAELVEVSPAAYALQSAYIAHGVVTERWATDALHVATATTTNCAIVVSWNFKHIANFRRIPLYNAVNALNGYNAIAIYSPLEVVEGDEEAL